MFIFIILVVVALFFALIPNVLYVLLKFISLFFSWSISYKPFGLTALVLLLVWCLLFLYGNIFGRFRSEVTKFDYTNSYIPESFDGYNIVHISDIHLDGWKGHEKDLQKIVDKVNALSPDLICFTGDLVSLSPNETADFVSILKQLKAKDGVVSVLGNHDYIPYSRKKASDREKDIEEIIRFEKETLGWTLLLNENITINHSNDSIAILGCENQSVGAHPVIQRGDLCRTMEHTDNMFRILLTHDPSQWRKEVVGKTTIPLTLSGHTHAMQFRIFGYTPSSFAYPECDGLYAEGKQSLYVNIGLGGTMPMRIGATPEITLITLNNK